MVKLENFAIAPEHPGSTPESMQFAFINNRPFIKDRPNLDSKQKDQYVNIFTEETLKNTILEFNKSQTLWEPILQISNLGPYFETYYENKQGQEAIITHKLKQGHKPSQAMEYFKNELIYVNANMATLILILEMVKKHVGDETFDLLHPIFVLICCPIDQNPLIQFLFRSNNFGKMRPCAISEQEKTVRKMNTGSLAYIRGSLGWYNFIMNMERYNSDKINPELMGCPGIVLDQDNFITWDAENYSFVIKPLKQIVEELATKGKENLMESVDKRKTIYKRYLVYQLNTSNPEFRLENKSQELRLQVIGEHIKKIFDQHQEHNSNVMKVQYDPFLPVGIDGICDMYLDLDAFNRIEELGQETTIIGQFMEYVLLAYKRGVYDMDEAFAIYRSFVNYPKEYISLLIIDSFRHQVHNLYGWNNKVPQFPETVEPTSGVFDAKLIPEIPRLYPIEHHKI